jgi:hypothetical protein
MSAVIRIFMVKIDSGQLWSKLTRYGGRALLLPEEAERCRWGKLLQEAAHACVGSAISAQLEARRLGRNRRRRGARGGGEGVRGPPPQVASKGGGAASGPLSGLCIYAHRVSHLSLSLSARRAGAHEFPPGGWRQVWDVSPARAHHHD